MALYKITGIDRKNNDLYRLGYTGNLRKAKRYHIAMGWQKRDLIFEREGSQKE